MLLESSLLNDGPLRARLLHIANQHGIALVHPSVAHALETATELLLTRLVQGMMHSARLRSRHAKDVPGMVKDNNRNWEREVRYTLTACWQGAAVIICPTQGVRCSFGSRHSPLIRASATRYRKHDTLSKMQPGVTATRASDADGMQIAITAEAEKEAQARARHAQQQQLDQLTIAQHQNRCAPTLSPNWPS